ncbi:HDOD domain-containing protein [Marinicellulosiphila megalodicopiae]|uniref:HDOD domain-containing protein n=1 Tax=Marinicellulosiphila megalodicopiae TaxID=2724896 RepID=UPI003BAE4CA8
MPITITTSEQILLSKMHLPVRPKILVNIITEAKKNEPNMYLISQWISEDVGVASAVLKIVNSPLFARQTNIISIQQAVMLLGFNRVFSIVKTVALKGTFTNTHKLSTFWQLSAQIAHTAINIAHFLDKPEYGDSAYVLGLFHMSGVPTLYENFEGYQNTFEIHQCQGWDAVAKQERSLYQTSHTTLSAFIAQQWDLTPSQVEAIFYVFDCDGIFESDELSQEALTIFTILKIARRCVFQHCNIENESEWSAIKEGIESFLQIDETDLEELIFQTEHQFD